MSGISSGIGRVQGAIGAVQGIARQVGAVSGAVRSLASDLGILGPPAGANALGGLGVWALGMQPASWNGVPFVVRSAGIRCGRRVVVHEYPYRDDVWVEDLGRAVRSFSFTGFLVGDDVYAQRDAMVAAVETGQPGQLVHPSLGSLTVSLTEFSATERADLGRVVEIEFAFIFGEQPQNPTTDDDTQDDVFTGAGTVDSASQSDFLSKIGSAIQSGTAAIQSGVQTVLGWTNTAMNLVNDASRVVGAVTGLGFAVSAFFGRFGAGNLVAAPPQLGPISQTLPVVARTELATASMLAASITAATAVQTAASGFAAAMGGFTAATAAGASGVSEALRAACADPADAVRLLSALAQYAPSPPPVAAPIGQAIVTVQTATAALCRRAAIASLARATATYQPQSYNDAITVMGSVTALINAEAEIAADNDDDQTYGALCTLAQAVTIDLITRGAALPALQTVTRAASLPALFLAYQLYQDTTQTAALIGAADPIHPAFMPLQFQAPL